MTIAGLFERGEPIEIVSDCQFTEGPLWHPGGYLIFSDIPANTTYRWHEAEGLSVFRRPTGNANGLALGPDGSVLACEHTGRRVSSVSASGAESTLVADYEGFRLNSPNDIVVARDGSVYFTDPPYGITEEQRELPFNGVFRVGTDGVLDLLLSGMDRPNGLAFSPDESVLYVADTERHVLRAVTFDAGGQVASVSQFCDMEADGGRPGRPDGIKVDVSGRIFVAGMDGVWVYASDGEYLGRVDMAQRPANLAFGGDDWRTLFVTARTSVYALRTLEPGLAPTYAGS